MDNTTYFLLVLLIAIIFLSFFSTLTKNARIKLEAIKQYNPERHPTGVSIMQGMKNNNKDFPPQVYDHPSVYDGEYQTPGYWFTELFSPNGVLGMFCSGLQIPVLAINSYILALRFEVMFGRAGIPLFMINFLTWNRDITDFDLLGLLISLGQMICAAAMLQGFILKKDCSPRYKTVLTVITFISWCFLVLFEIIVSFYSGLLISATWNAVLSMLLACGIVFLEGILGVYVLDYFIVPVLLSITWTIATPIRGLARWIERKRAQHRSRVPKQLTIQCEVKKKLHPVDSILSTIDELVFQPLRRLDEIVYNCIYFLISKVKNVKTESKELRKDYA